MGTPAMAVTCDMLKAASEQPRRWLVHVRREEDAEMGAHACIRGVKHGGGRAAADEVEVGGGSHGRRAGGGGEAPGEV